MYSVWMIWLFNAHASKGLNKKVLDKMVVNDFKVHYLLKLIAFWLLYFALFRILFVIYNYSEIPQGDFLETGKSFFYGLRLDLSTACILIYVPFFLWTIQQFLKSERIYLLNRFYNYGLIILVAVLSIANMKMYGEWGTLLSARALKYLLYPREAISFISVGSLSVLLLSCILLAYAGISLYKKLSANFTASKSNTKKIIAESLLIPLLILVGSRGGIQLSPINESNSYFSTVQINNLIATNNIWYLGHSILEANDTKNPYIFSEPEKAKILTAALFKNTSDVSQPILNTKKPNIVFIVLESWTADIVERLGGDKNITPHFNELTKEGLLFSQMYGSGFRTEQGLVSIFSGFPAQPNNSIVTTPSKAEQLPSLTSILAKAGYSNSFYYGGEIEFANIKSYLLHCDFEKIIDKNDFQKNQLNSKWGAHDEFVLEKQLEGLKNEQEPFCSVVLTLSSHEPFEVTMSTPFNGTDEVEKFKKAAYYSDYCLFNYFEKAKKQSWYKNTLFILVADHGHRLPKNRNMNLPEGRRITAFLTGGALTDSLRGRTFDKIVNQNDLAATLLSQLKMDHSEFIWSKDFFNSTTQEFAYYSNENVLGWICPDERIVYTYSTGSTEELSPQKKGITQQNKTLQAKAYLQTLYQQYLEY